MFDLPTPETTPLTALLQAHFEMSVLLRTIVESPGRHVWIANAASSVVESLTKAADFHRLTLTWDTEWASAGVMASASAANLILARLIAHPVVTGDTQTRQFAHDLHWVASHMARVCAFVGTDLATATNDFAKQREEAEAAYKARIDPVREMRDRGPYGPGVTAAVYGADVA